MALSPGTHLGPYEIVAPLGAGGMGEVYRATDMNLARQVAIKVLPESVAADPERLARFEREARTLAALNHPNIAQIHGLERADGTIALVMELVEGPTLADRIAHGPIPVDEALPIARQVAEALEAAHEQGIIHRDLKPANIKVRPDGTVKVLDFGLAKAMEPAGVLSLVTTQSPTITTPAMTQVGMILGTAAYMSPEQAKGKSADKRSDVWAFGAVLFEMVTGTRAFAGDDVADTLASVLKGDVEWAAVPSSTPPRVVRTLHGCLERDRRQRIRDIGDVRLALDGAFESAIHTGERTVAGAQSVWRRPGLLTSVGGVALLAMGLAAWGLSSPTEPAVVTRFEHDLAEGQSFRSTGRPVLAVSPDGASFAYNAEGGVYVRGMDSLEPRLVPGTEGAVTTPVYSPDSQWLAYYEAGQLKRVAISGGAPIVLAARVESPFGASWESDGTILYGQSDGIWRVSETGGDPELVIPARDGEAVHGPQLLPDGDSVLFSATRATGGTRWDEGEIVVQSIASGERAVLLRSGSEARYLPTGHLIYALERNLFGVALDLNERQVRGVPATLVQGVLRSGDQATNTATANYGVTRSGTLVYVASTGARLRRLDWVTREGAAERIETVPGGRSPRLSPDGARVLVEANGDVWVYEIATGRSSRITTDGVSERGAWDPTGSRVAYTSMRSGNQQVWVAPADGSGDPQQVTNLEGGRVHMDSWSPSGLTLAVHQHTPDGRVNILMVDVNDRDATPRGFLERPSNDAEAVFSPDGRYVAYRSDETGQHEVYIRPISGAGGQRVVSVNGGRQPVWARNGELFYRDLSGEVMMAVSVTTEPALEIGTPRQLFRGTFFNMEEGGSPRPQYAVTSDGQRFLMLEVDPSERPRVVVVQGWIEELKRLLPTD